ncbi:hypothetical protein ElyMa_002456800 [Elysia marginata]|uniref:Uncharacterized protein n=1 Tax=Elysia marginata TaxID=1093978 RepID=A0AAV4GN35_9GAST|nr:hypothetical protein ElyMa_002456800 [Elysia marginata]
MSGRAMAPIESVPISLGDVQTKSEYRLDTTTPRLLSEWARHWPDTRVNSKRSKQAPPSSLALLLQAMTLVCCWPYRQLPQLAGGAWCYCRRQYNLGRRSPIVQH